MEHVEDGGEQPLVSIFIRARNEAAYIEQCLEAVFRQETNFPFEVVVLDSGSTDGTPELTSRFDVRLYSIPPELFTYSAALNLGVELCRGIYFAPLSAHAVPASDQWLKFHVEHLEGNSDCVATFSRQIPWGDESRPELSALLKSFPKPSMSYGLHEVRTFVGQGGEAYQAVPFSNASSVIRMDVARELMFREMPFSEDRAFALDAVSGENRRAEVGYVGEAAVHHSHTPRFFTFYHEARKATISRGLINRLYREKVEPGYDPGMRESRLWLYLKLLPLTALVALRVVLSVPRGTLSRLRGNAAEQHRAQREAKFYLSSYGTTLGKIRGIWEFQSVRDYACPVASTQQLKESLTRLK